MEWPCTIQRIIFAGLLGLGLCNSVFGLQYSGPIAGAWVQCNDTRTRTGDVQFALFTNKSQTQESADTTCRYLGGRLATLDTVKRITCANMAIEWEYDRQCSDRSLTICDDSCWSRLDQ
eukprot:scpid108744/ scgid27948/ 